MSVIGSLEVNVLARTKAFVKGMRDSRKGLKGFSGDVASANKGLAGFQKSTDAFGKAIRATAALLAANQLTSFLKSTNEGLDTLGKTAQSLNVSVSALDRYQFAAGRAGIESTKITDALATMTRQLGEAKVGAGEAAAFFEKLGIDLAPFFDLNPDQQFLSLGNAIGKLKDPNKQLAAFSKIFGEGAGRDIGRFFADGNFEKASADLQKLGGAITTDDTQRAAAFNDAIGDLGRSLGRFSQDAVVDVTPFLTGFTNQLSAGLQSIRDIRAEIDRNDRNQRGAGDGLRLKNGRRSQTGQTLSSFGSIFGADSLLNPSRTQTLHGPVDRSTLIGNRNGGQFSEGRLAAEREVKENNQLALLRDIAAASKRTADSTEQVVTPQANQQVVLLEAAALP